MTHFRQLSKALEDNESSSSIETEITIFTKLVDLGQLDILKDFEDHEQLEARLVTDGKVRVRKTTKPDTVDFDLTLKTPMASKNTTQNNEGKASITEEMFESFRTIANQKWLKRRYHIPVKKTEITLQDKSPALMTVDDLIYEVDVFQDTEGRWVEWVKIDLEIDMVFAVLRKEYPDLKEFNLKIKLGKLPFQHTGAFIKETATPEQKAFLDQLFQNKYNLQVT